MVILRDRHEFTFEVAGTGIPGVATSHHKPACDNYRNRHFPSVRHHRRDQPNDPNGPGFSHNMLRPVSFGCPQLLSAS
jgi:hypothetical protein